MSRPAVLTKPFAFLVGGHFFQALGYASLILLPVYLDHLGANRTQVGLVMAAAALGGLLVRPLVAWSLDRVGRKATLYVGSAILGGGLLAIGLVDRVGPLIGTLHGVIGIGEAALFTGYFTFAADIVPAERRTEGLALFGISGLVPLVVNPLAGGIGIEGEMFRVFFPAVGVLVLGSALFLVPLEEPASRGTRVPLTRTDVADALRHRGLWPVWLATFVFAGLVAIFMSFSTVVAADRGVDNAGIIWLTYAFGAVSVRLFGAGLPDRLGPSRVLPAALGAYVAAAVLAAMATGGWAFAAAGLLAGFGHGYAFPILSSQTVSRTRDALRGSAMSVFTGLWDVAKLALVPAAGVLADATSDGSMLVVSAAVASVGLVGWALLERGLAEGPRATS